MNLFFGNFDFEHHLGPEGRRVPPAQIRRLNDEMAFCLLPLAQSGDLLWTPEQPELAFAEHLEEIGLPRVRFVSPAQDIPPGAVLVPWGWCKSVESWAAKNSVIARSPDSVAVAEANSREFSSGLETEWNVGLPGARAIRTLPELDHILSEAAKLPGGWVIKANFGMSARERIVVRRRPPRTQDVEWARRRLQRGEPTFFEPWVESLAEFGCQFTVPKSGQPVLEGITGLLTDAQGTYRGSRLLGMDRVASSDFPDSGVVDIVERAATRIQQLGYFGPLGIDVMRYRTPEGEIRWRPLQDINARLTMGRVALGLGRLLAAGERADWLHLRWSGNSASASRQMSSALGALPAGARALCTSPQEVGGRPVLHGTALIMAPSTEILDTVFLTIQTVHETRRNFAD